MKKFSISSPTATATATAPLFTWKLKRLAPFRRKALHFSDFLFRSGVENINFHEHPDSFENKRLV